jgi:ATP-dependent Clp protease ATP-binding subunit ClpA
LCGAAQALDAMSAAATSGEVTLSDASKAVLQAALAVDEQHCRGRVATEHLVSALLKHDDSAVLTILCAAGPDVERTRRLVGIARLVFRRPSEDAVRLIATSKWLVRDYR